MSAASARVPAPVRCLFAAYGEAAFEALAREIDDAKAASPLAPVTVVVRSNLVGLDLRRRLARRASSGGIGIINAAFVTLARLAADLAAPAVISQGRSRLGDSVLQVAVRAELSTGNGGELSELGHHAATVRSLAATYRDLRGVPEAVLDRLDRRGGRARELARLARRVRERVAPRYFDEEDLFVEATKALAVRDRLAESLGMVVLHLPHDLSSRERAFVAALSGAVPTAAVIGVTGDARADEVAADRARWLGGSMNGGSAIPGTVDAVRTSTTVVRAPSADAEVLHVLRQVMDRNAAGTPFASMAVTYTTDEPYARLVRDSLEQAQIPYTGSRVRQLSATAAGRVVLGLIDLPETRWRRDALIDWLSSAPILFRGEPVPVAAWDVLSCDAGIVGGLDEWRRHLDAYRAARTEELSRYAAGRDDAPIWHEQLIRRQLSEADDLRAFLDELSGMLDAVPDSWAGWSTWAVSAARDLLGSDVERAEWPDEEIEAYNAIVEILEVFSGLDALGVPARPNDVRTALAAALEARAPQATRFGTGVFVCRLDHLVGLHFDTVFVVGAHDGVTDPGSRDDPVLPDRERVELGPEVPARAMSVAERRLRLLAAVASAPEAVISYPMGDQRHGRPMRPSRWWLDALEQIAGSERRLFSRDVDAFAECDGYVVLPSYAAAVRRPGEACAEGDYELRSLLRFVEDGGRLDGHFLCEPGTPLARAVEVRRSHRQRHLTRFDGLVPGRDVASPANGVAQSPTHLEEYAQCPRRYLLSTVLRVEDRDKPDEIDRISPQDKGSLVHRILEEFLREEVGRPRATRIGPGTAWSEAHRGRLDEIAHRIFSEYETRGLVGRRPFWRIERARILRDLATFLDEDSRYRAAYRVVPDAVEHRFGSGGTPAVTVDLPQGGSVAVKGFIDRIDRADDGTTVVIDYKTGGTWGTGDLESDPVVRGTKLQLALYGLAARRGGSADPVHAFYWFITERGRFDRRGYAVDEIRRARLTEVMGTVVGSIESGLFPGRPGPKGSNCTFCPYDRLCPPDRERQWELKREDPAVAAYRALAEP